MVSKQEMTWNTGLFHQKEVYYIETENKDGM